MTRQGTDATFAFRQEAAALLGARGFRTDDAELAPCLSDWRGIFDGRACGLALPGSTAEAAALVALAARHGIAVVPQGGNTGLSGAATPDASGSMLIIGMKRMNRIRALDTADNTITAEAGCILADIQQAAADAGRMFPLSLAAEGSCQIGGNLATNAGGINVLKFGNARALTLGIEAVLPDGSVFEGLSSLHKDNAGYDLKQLFIGSEGTLGLITAATLKLFPAFHARATALLALPDLGRAASLLARCRAGTADQLIAFELFPDFGIGLAMRHFGLRDPLPGAAPWRVLVEAATPSSDFAIGAALEQCLADALAAGEISDGLVADTEGKRRDLWRLREAMVSSQQREGASIKHDISVPVTSIAGFVAEASAAIAGAWPQARILCFGHVGDGNLHFNLLQPEGADPAAFTALTGAVNRLVHDLVAAHRGSISAEHGIGQLRREELRRLKSPVALDLMARVKAAIDPENRFNPGKVL